MEGYNLMELGRLITKRRKELGKKQSELSDEQISVAYISGIENGRFQPSKGKLAHLCSKLELTTIELENSLKLKEREPQPSSIEKLKLELFAIEDDMDSENLEDGYRQLKALAEPLLNNDPLMVIVHHLKGKYYLEKGNWKQAITQFTQSIQKLQLHEKMKNSNIEAYSYYCLSRISNYLNNVPQSLHYTKKGINAFIPNGERAYVQHHLFLGKAIYYSSLNQTEEAMQILDTMWDQMGYVKSSQVLLNMYELKAHLLNKTQKYGEAITVAKKGLELARIDRAYERKFELWTTLGTSYLKLQQLEEAKCCFQAADKLTKKVKNEYLFIRTKTQIGLLHLQENNIPLATTTLKEAVQLGKKTKDYSRLYEATIALGDCYLKQQNEQQAQTHYELGLKLSQELSLEEQIPAVLLRLAKCTEKYDRKSYDFYTSQFIELSVKSTLGGDSMLFTTQIEHPYIKREADPPPA